MAYSGCGEINLGLAIGAPRADGFHSLRTLYQTLALHDVVEVSAKPARATRIRLQSNDPRVPLDSRNTVWKMVERALDGMGRTAEVAIHIEKRLPIQGGMGAGSANAAAALVGLERELGLKIPEAARLRMAAAVGSDVPLFLVGGAVFGENRGEEVSGAPPVTVDGGAEIACVIALPGHGVSTPQAFRDWDALLAGVAGEAGPPAARTDDSRNGVAGNSAGDLHNPSVHDTLEKLSRTYASVFGSSDRDKQQSGASGIFPEPSSAALFESDPAQNSPENLQGTSSEQLHPGLTFESSGPRGGIKDDLAENTLLALVRTGIENDFETVVFPQYPSLREIKRQLMGFSDEGNAALYAALSGSGSALFGLYRTQARTRMPLNEGSSSMASRHLSRRPCRALSTGAKMFAE